MKSFQFAVFMLFWMSAAPVMPEEAGTLPIPPDTAIKPDHPAYYVVGKEDTLWDIAEVFLEDPWVVTDAWWSQEPFIYLGDIITPANLEEQAVLQIEHDPAVKLFPENRVIPPPYHPISLIFPMRGDGLATDPNTDIPAVHDERNSPASLKIWNADIHAVLLFFADFKDSFNVIINGAARGSVSLNVRELPWRQILQVILAEKNLAVKQLTSSSRIYKGEPISINFQHIEISDVLNLIADFRGINIVFNASSYTTLSLRLKNVPWDLALDGILKANGLALWRSGNVWHIDTKIAIAARGEPKVYQGEAISVNFQQIEVGPLLRFFANLKGFSVEIADDVQGIVNLRLRNVPWTQALDVILDMHGLGIYQIGDLFYVYSHKGKDSGNRHKTGLRPNSLLAAAQRSETARKHTENSRFFSRAETNPKHGETPGGNKQPQKSCPPPSAYRKRSPLEFFSLYELKMHGTLSGKGEIQAVVSTPDGAVYPVKVNHFLGLNNGQVININDYKMELRETVQHGECNFEERLAVLNLFEETENGDYYDGYGMEESANSHSIMPGCLPPDRFRVREALEQFHLEEFNIKGILKEDEQTRALVEDAKGLLYSVGTGNYMGKNFGRIIDIADTTITLNETVDAYPAACYEERITVINFSERLSGTEISENSSDVKYFYTENGHIRINMKTGEIEQIQ